MQAKTEFRPVTIAYRTGNGEWKRVTVKSQSQLDSWITKLESEGTYYALRYGD